MDLSSARKSSMRPGKAANAGGVCRQRTGDGPEQHALELVGRGGGRALADHRPGDPPHLPGSRRDYGTPGNYLNGANIAGFVKVVNAMVDQGVV
ncbi:MAG: hypothetical protein MZV70_73495 [Desulfobacterales bacterium]|nr:hypothetical protein [Desulfobacterales bacterium]